MPWAESVGEGKSKRAEKLARKKKKRGGELKPRRLRLNFSSRHVSTSSPTLSAHGSPRMISTAYLKKVLRIWPCPKLTVDFICSTRMEIYDI